jgi:hypothetical protein
MLIECKTEDDSEGEPLIKREWPLGGTETTGEKSSRNIKKKLWEALYPISCSTLSEI